MNRQFLLYVLPAILSFTLSGVYAIVDGFFVGRSIGDAGLAAINLAYPITALIQAIGTGIGMGGAIWISISRGRGDGPGEKRYFTHTILLLELACLAVTILLWGCAEGLLGMFGAKGELLDLAGEYIRWIVWGTTFQILGTGLVPILRNLGSSIAAMSAMVLGFLTNILLDYLFVARLGYGMSGAAVATLIGQAATVSVCVLCLAAKGRLLTRRAAQPGAAMREILTTGLSPFGLAFCPNLAVILVNKTAVSYGGEEAVACYAVVSYILVIVQMLMQGIGDGSQPLISRYYGEGSHHKVRETCGAAYLLAVLLSVAGAGAILWLRRPIIAAFGVSPQVLGRVAAILPVFLAGIPFIGFLRVTTSYFYATHRNSRAYLLIYGEPLLLFAMLLAIFPPFLGLPGVWISTPFTQLCLALAGVLLIRKASPISPR